jgi:hypothetical protein
MLSRLVLLAVQLAVGWFGAPYIVQYIPNLGGLQLFVYAVVFAVLVWVVGLILSQVLRETGMPSSSTLVTSLVVALIGAALITWLPAIVPDLAGTMRQVRALVYPLIGAVIGYHIKR